MAYNGGDVRQLQEGYLYKSPDSPRYLSIMKKWQHKLFRLMENGDLHYFDSEKSPKPAGTIHLLDCHRVFDPKTRGLHVNYCLGMDVGENTYYVKADTASLYNVWLDMIAAFAEKNDASPAPSPSSVRRNSALSEVRGHQGDSVSSRTLSISTKMNSVEKSGWLYKTGPKTGPTNKGWNHRFFVLSSGKISYYKTDKVHVEKCLGTIDLRECIRVSQASFKKGYGLTIQVPNRTYNLSAESEAEQEEWITALTAATSMLESSKLSVGPESSVIRSGSGSSQSSVTSRELFSSSAADTHSTTTQLTGRPTDGVLSDEDQTGGQEKRTERDSVVQLLEAEVDALRGQVSSLTDELKSSSAVTAQLQAQLQESVLQREREVHSITVDRDNLHAKVSELESAKQSLESVNDSLRLQLDEMREQGLEVEEMRVRGELEETQAALTAAEEDIKTYQQELSDTQHLLQEIQTVARDLQAELVKRGDFTPDSFCKKRSLSTTASELLSSLNVPSGTHLDTHLELHERPATAERYRARRREEGDGGIADPPSLPVFRQGGEGGREEGEGGGVLLEEEKLKWQMEMENLRRECERREEVVREKCAAEVREWEQRVRALEERCAVMMREVEKGRESSSELDQVKQRMRVLEAELEGAREKVVQLQTEKEKALSDLKNIRKLNRTIEKRLSLTGNHDTEGSEVKIEELQRQLDVVQKERDQLRAQVDEIMASTNERTQSRGDLPMELSPLMLRRKGRATVAASHNSLAAPTIERGSSFSVVASSVANGHTPTEAPVKPQRPPKAVINGKLTAVNQDRGNPRPKTWGSNMFTNLFRS